MTTTRILLTKPPKKEQPPPTPDPSMTFEEAIQEFKHKLGAGGKAKE